MTLILGTRVKVTNGEHHGKTGEVSSVALKGSGASTTVIPTIRFTDNTTAEVSGRDLVVIR